MYIYIHICTYTTLLTYCIYTEGDGTVWIPQVSCGILRCMSRCICHGVYVTGSVAVCMSLAVWWCVCHWQCHGVYVAGSVMVCMSLAVSRCICHWQCDGVYDTGSVMVCKSMAVCMSHVPCSAVCMSQVRVYVPSSCVCPKFVVTYTLLWWLITTCDTHTDHSVAQLVTYTLRWSQYSRKITGLFCRMYKALLQKRPRILSSLLTAAPYCGHSSQSCTRKLTACTCSYVFI